MFEDIPLEESSKLDLIRPCLLKTIKKYSTCCKPHKSITKSDFTTRAVTAAALKSADQLLADKIIHFIPTTKCL